KAPAVAVRTLGLAPERTIDPVRTEHAGVDPGAARGAAVGAKLVEAFDLTAVMQARLIGVRVKTVDLAEHRFRRRLAVLVFRVPPVGRSERLVDRIAGGFRARFQPLGELMHEPQLAARIA